MSLLAGAPQDVVNKYGDIRDEKFFMNLFKDGPELCGQTCAWLATGQGKELRGLYLGEFDWCMLLWNGSANKT
jgi:hypothetical protein